MKKQNNRYRNSNNNNSYTLNYKFDSVSIAGKISGTALDLIRKYNDLAKEAQSSGDYVNMEIYRQYAEHYRKIVTDINERRQTRIENNYNRNNDAETQSQDANNTCDTEEKTEVVEAVASDNGYVETLPANEIPQKTFEVVEINENAASTDEPIKQKRVCRRKTTVRKTKEA